jgi:cardiolipin synthase
VLGLEAAFWGNWLETSRDRMLALSSAPPPGPAGAASVQVVRPEASVGWNVSSALFWSLCEAAERRLAISTPYLNPDFATRLALKRAADRGVAVEVMIPGPHLDSPMSWLLAHEAQAQLVEANITLWEYQPTMLHLKQVLVDDDLACVGSVNLNQRSRRRDDEVALLVEDGQLARRLWQDFADDRARSEQITRDRLRQRSWGRRAAAALVRPLRHEI